DKTAQHSAAPPPILSFHSNSNSVVPTALWLKKKTGREKKCATVSPVIITRLPYKYDRASRLLLSSAPAPVSLASAALFPGPLLLPLTSNPIQSPRTQVVCVCVCVIGG
uniref:Uncharacterized protein n=1 Tax=Aegilops tauschii subsp. strangulata TaxID=200361 RepID=A0A453I7W1_AEGTS